VIEVANPVIVAPIEGEGSDFMREVDIAADETPTGQRRLGGRFWFALHGWFALPVWGGLLLICLTGTLCTVSQEITWLYDSKVRADPSAGAPRLDLVQAAIAQAYPEANIDSVQIEEPYFAYRVRIGLPGDDRKTLFVNPYTGELQGEAEGAGFRGFILALHGWLLLPWQGDYSLGWYLVTLFSMPLLGSLVTALLMLKRFWRFFYQPRVRLGKGARVFWGDLHRLLGVWSIWFVAIVGASGLWFLIQGALVHNQVAIYPSAPALSPEAVAVTATTTAPKNLPLEVLVARAKDEYPDLRIKYIKLPEYADDTVIVRGNRSWSLFRDNVNAVYLNPYNGETVAAHSPGNVSVLHAVGALITPLHFGNFGGLVSKLVWFFFGCLLSLIIGGGFFVWSKRTFDAIKREGPREKPRGRNTRERRKKGAVAPITWGGFAFLSWLLALLPLYFLYQQLSS